MIYFQDILFSNTSEGLQWFRDNYNLYGQVEIDCTSYPKFAYTIYSYTKEEGIVCKMKGGRSYSNLYRTYPEAEYYCLMELIEMLSEDEN